LNCLKGNSKANIPLYTLRLTEDHWPPYTVCAGTGNCNMQSSRCCQHASSRITFGEPQHRRSFNISHFLGKGGSSLGDGRSDVQHTAMLGQGNSITRPEPSLRTVCKFCFVYTELAKHRPSLDTVGLTAKHADLGSCTSIFPPTKGVLSAVCAGRQRLRTGIVAAASPSTLLWPRFTWPRDQRKASPGIILLVLLAPISQHTHNT
jgi:hypothetical protein